MHYCFKCMTSLQIVPAIIRDNGKLPKGNYVRKLWFMDSCQRVRHQWSSRTHHTDYEILTHAFFCPEGLLRAEKYDIHSMLINELSFTTTWYSRFHIQRTWWSDSSESLWRTWKVSFVTNQRPKRSAKSEEKMITELLGGAVIALIGIKVYISKFE